MRNYAGTCEGIYSDNLMQNFQSSVFVMHFSSAFWHGYEEFPKGSS